MEMVATPKTVISISDITVSIIVPIYNVQDYILDCLNSVSRQTYQGSMECLLVDDCGSDDSMQILYDFISAYKGPIDFKIIHHNKNLGLSAARNSGIKEAKGEYMFFLDSDDIIEHDCISSLIELVKKYPSVDIVQGTTKVGNNIWHAISEQLVREYSNDIEWIRENMCQFNIPDPAWNKLINTRFVRENRIYFEEGIIQEDTLWAYMLQKYVTSVAFCPTYTYEYRLNPKGIMQSNKGNKEAQSFSIICNIVYADLKKRNVIKPYEIRFLEINALRIGNAGGLDGIKMLKLYNNHLFRLLHRLNTKNYERGKFGSIKEYIRLKLIISLRMFLCIPKFL